MITSDWHLGLAPILPWPTRWFLSCFPEPWFPIWARKSTWWTRLLAGKTQSIPRGATPAAISTSSSLETLKELLSSGTPLPSQVNFKGQDNHILLLCFSREPGFLANPSQKLYWHPQKSSCFMFLHSARENLLLTAVKGTKWKGRNRDLKVLIFAQDLRRVTRLGCL